MRGRRYRFHRFIIALCAATVAAAGVPAIAGPDGLMATDMLGRAVQIPETPMRIVSLAPSITEIVFALGQGHRLSGVTRFSDYPVAAQALPKVGSYVQLDLERIVSLRPDLCVAVKDGNPKAVVDRLESLGIPVFAVDPRDLNAVLETIATLGGLLNARDAADALVVDLERRIQGVVQRRDRLRRQPTVFFQIGLAPIVSVGTDTFIHELIGLAGGVNLAAGPVPYPRFSQEEVVAMAPDLIVITSMAREGIFETIRSEWMRWRNMPAARNDGIVLVDSNLFDRASPRLVDGLERLADIIHDPNRQVGL